MAGNFIGLKLIYVKVDVDNLFIKAISNLDLFAVLLDDEEVEVVVVEGLALFDVVLVAQDVAKELVVPRLQLIEEGLDRLQGELSFGDGLDEVGGLEQEVEEVEVLLDVLAVD